MSRLTDKETTTDEAPLGYLYTHVDCPGCSEPSELEGDCGGDNVECDVCGCVFKIREVR